MAVVTRSCLGIDIGSRFIRIAHIERGRTGPRVLSLIEEPLELPPGLTEAQRNRQIGRQIQDMLKKARIRTSNAVFCVPGLYGLIKRFSLPRTRMDNIEQIVRYEARQQIPFPLDQTSMEFQVFEDEGTPQLNVLLAALKQDYISNFMRMVDQTGLKAVAVSVSSLALHNFHELNAGGRDLSPDAGKARVKAKKQPGKPAGGGAAEEQKPGPLDKVKGLFKRGGKGEDTIPRDRALVEAEGAADEELEALDSMGFEEVKAYVHLGASYVDIAIPKPGSSRMIGFPRSVPVAGNEMDRAIRNKLGLEDFDAARRVKENETVVLSAMFDPGTEGEGVNMEASEAVTAVADRMIAELRRSLDFYISQPDGVAVDSLVISGGLARLRYLTDYIEEKIGLPVELAEPDEGRMRMPEPPPDPFLPYTVALGLAFQGVGYANTDINFLPEDRKNFQQFASQRWEVVGMLAVVAVMIALNTTVGRQSISLYEGEAQQLQQQIAQNSRMDKQITEAEQRHRKVATAYDALAKTVTNRSFWFDFLEAFNSKRPPDVLIDELHLRTDGNVVVRGKSPSQYTIRTFLQGLGELKADPQGIVKNEPELAEIRPIRDTRFPDNTETSDFTFTLKVPVLQGRVRSIGEQPAPPEPTPDPNAPSRPGFLGGALPGMRRGN